MILARRLYSWFVLHVIGLAVVVSILTSFLPKPVVDRSGQIADNLTFAALYAGVFLYLLSMSVLVGYMLRWLRDRMIYPTDHWPISRHAALIAIGGTALLALQGVQVLSVWDSILLIVALCLVEISFHVKSS